MQLWSPSAELVDNSNINKYIKWLKSRKQLIFSDYESLWKWSVSDTDQFWTSLVEYFEIIYEGQDASVTNGMPMPKTRWFDGLSLSYSEHVFRQKDAQHPAIVCRCETGQRIETSWGDLESQVASLQSHLKESGVTMHDRVVAYMPCTTEATIAFLAVNSLGAAWSSCSPDFGTAAVIERFSQIEPKILIATSQYGYGGKVFDKVGALQELITALPTLQQIIIVGESVKPLTLNTKLIPLLWADVTQKRAELTFNRVPFGHPIWILYSSGTTGKPKAIVHSTGGILLEHLKYGSFHNDIHRGENCFWYTTTGWMMWNYIHGCLLSGGTLVLYDGSPGYPDLMVLWKLAEEERINHFGTSAAFILSNMKQAITPGKSLSLSALRSIGCTGSTLPPEGFQWIYTHVKPDVWLASMSGGTDVCSAFVGGNPTWPVYAGEIQCRALGCKLEAFDEEGHPIVNEVGEMVITKPMPSMPLYFWNDPGMKRYSESYFEMYPGVWRHGDWIMITEHSGVVIYGRSDATLNRGGIRIGTSEIYSALDAINEVKDSLIVCIEKAGGLFWMPLFVVMQDGATLTQAVRDSINASLKMNYSPRHVPDEIIAVPEIPYTLSGKKTETPVKKILMGIDKQKAVNKDVLRNPGSINFFIELLENRNASK